LARYLVRVANSARYQPKDSQTLARTIRELLGGRETIGHLRVGSKAVELDLFANDPQELRSRISAIESKIGKVVTLKPLDQLPQAKNKLDIIREGIKLFNQERFWECHEVLEQAWHPAKGIERDIIQGLILTAAGLVHVQRDEIDVSLSMLKKAWVKLGTRESYEGIDLNKARLAINRMLESKHPEAFKIKLRSVS
jgi:hypothetical protein